jgi:hypothetical protein
MMISDAEETVDMETGDQEEETSIDGDDPTSLSGSSLQSFEFYQLLHHSG